MCIGLWKNCRRTSWFSGIRNYQYNNICSNWRSYHWNDFKFAGNATFEKRRTLWWWYLLECSGRFQAHLNPTKSDLNPKWNSIWIDCSQQLRENNPMYSNRKKSKICVCVKFYTVNEIRNIMKSFILIKKKKTRINCWKYLQEELLGKCSLVHRIW